MVALGQRRRSRRLFCVVQSGGAEREEDGSVVLYDFVT
jgi:hypothetical protein